MHVRKVLLAVLVLSIAAFAQNTADTPFQVRYAANLQLGESYIDIVNTGANGAPAAGPGFGGSTGNICVNVYAIDPGEELISCCSCLVTPDQVVNLGVNRDLTSKTQTGVVPQSVTIKLLASSPNASTCTNTAGTILPGAITNGMAAWGTTLHATPVAGGVATTETAFTPSTLSPGEFLSLVGRCAAIIGNSSGFGICASCRAGSLGSAKM
jgi:hypothetical protein